MEPPPRCEFESNKLILKFEVAIPASLEKVALVIEQTMKVIQGMRCAEGKEFEIETALREAMVNAVVHGARSDPDKMVQCCVACDESRGMLIIVRDPGRGFDPESLPSPVMGENIFAAHGRGIYMINQLMDEVSFQRGGTEIHMRKRGAG